MSFSPRIDVLPAAQRRLWEEMAGVPREFTLYGGTAIALHLAHRTSFDFDFFGAEAFNPAELFGRIPLLAGAKIIQQAKSTLTCLVTRGGPVKVSFFGVPLIGCVEAPSIAADNQLKVASLTDLAGTKAAVVQQRAEAKDYIDLDAILCAGIGLPSALAAAKVIYGPSFNPQLTLKSLCYFGDGDLRMLPEETKRRLVKAVSETDLDRLPLLEPRQGPQNEGAGGKP